MNKVERMEQILRDLLKNPKGLRQSEIAQRLNTPRSTICRTIRDMSSLYPIGETDDGRIVLQREKLLTNVKLSMFELEALHLAARLFLRVMRFPFPHAAAALCKLAEAQGKVSPALAARIRDTAEDIETTIPAGDVRLTCYQKTIEELGRAITDGACVELSHYSRREGREKTYRVIPVTLEPHFEGRAVHLVAWDLGTDPPSWRTLKTERISAVKMCGRGEDALGAGGGASVERRRNRAEARPGGTGEGLPDSPRTTAAQPPVGELRERFASAWSIWTADGEPVEVVLRFSRTVADRVQETLWHGSQRLTENADGTLEFAVRVAEPREMYPWIRGWGPDVEVIGPEWLRQMHRGDFERGMKIYS